MELVAVTCWQMRLLRNTVVFGRKNKDPASILNHIYQQWNEVIQVDHNISRKSLPNTPVIHRWESPIQGQLKLNCNASFQQVLNRGQIAVIGRNRVGEVIHVISVRNKKNPSAATTEAIAIKVAVRFALENGAQEAVIESNALTVVKQINERQTLINWEYAVVLEEIQNMLSANRQRGLNIQFISRQANGVADWIARSSTLISVRDILCNSHKQLSYLIRQDALYARVMAV